MGNCQAAEAATVVIQHPLGVNGKGRKIERYYQSMSAKEVMNSNPGHYIALIILVPSANSGETKSSAPIKQLKLLRPDDVLHLGHVYRLVSFEEVLKEFAAKKCVKLGRLIMKEKVSGNIIDGEKRKKISKSQVNSKSVQEQEVVHGGSNSSNNNGSSSRVGVGGIRPLHHQWRPALESISEIGT
ncbi:hypothetical protein C5167_013570 [Papaver somniferum]|uniref:Uncharacterized protein n=1 Tax=Papaver somniferum TaxID=3469 RepID=A0A4Y7J0Q2_PAPSO|nr:uncharacterized protein LOC113356697 [Papaver somniferum]XP_026455693.1 uncharacterized protein LOC113356697 [Papaver somniferum]RZC54714.1 hypothetical protein C5167_013570 [Papaver somniferum]